jgi:hypothetical protein
VQVEERVGELGLAQVVFQVGSQVGFQAVEQVEGQVEGPVLVRVQVGERVESSLVQEQ